MRRKKRSHIVEIVFAAASVVTNAKSCTVMIIVLLLGSVAGAAVDGASGAERSSAASGTKVLHFPADRVVGTLSVQRPRDPSGTAASDMGRLDDDGEWEFFGLARGDVEVPAGARIQLRIRPKPGVEDLSWLAKLGPSDLYRVILERGDASQIRVEALSHLTGLQSLMLSDTGITSWQLSSLKSLSLLRSLTLLHELSIHGDGIAELKNFPALEYLGCWGVASDEDVKHIAGLSNLRRLKLRTDAMRGEGLAYLAGLPRLEWLHLWGRPFVGNPLRHLEGCGTLKSLHVWNDRMGDSHLASIGQLASLQGLHVRKSPTNSHEFTDAGVAYLKNLKDLREIELPGCTISGLGVRHLAALPNLESIEEIAYIGSGLSTLASCPNLKRLRVSVKAVDVAVLAAFSRLEELDVVCKGASDQDLAHFEGLSGITCLTLWEALDISERGWASIGKLKRLEELKVYGQVQRNYVTNRGLNHLNALKNLEVLELRMSSRQAPVENAAHLDLGAISNLKIVRLSGLTLQEGDLAFLKGSKYLEELKLQNYCQLSEDVFSYIAGHSGLNRLEIIGITCTDGNALARLSGLKNLEFLSLTGRITDNALANVSASPALLGFDITTDVPVSSQTMAHLRNALPRVKTVNIKHPQKSRQTPQPSAPTTTTPRTRATRTRTAGQRR